MSLFSNRDRMWFGVIDQSTGASRMQWIETPDSGADVSHMGFSAESTLLNGGGYARNSWDSHKNFQFSWGESASPQLASIIQSYSNGSFGRGLVYFNDPMQYGLNILPSRWADPSMAINYEAPNLGGSVVPTGLPVAASALGLPSIAAQYNLPVNYNQSGTQALTLVVPPGARFTFGWIGSRVNANSGIYISSSGMTGITTGYVTPLVSSGSVVTNINGIAGSGGGIVTLRLRSNITASLVTINAMTARIFPAGEAVNVAGPWSSGEGHSGCRFVGKPTIINYNGVGGGQLGLSCILKETGAWE